MFLCRIGRILFLLAMLAVLLIALYPFAAKHLLGVKHPTVFGYSTAVVVSGSMSGSIEVNDVVVIHKQDMYKPDDIISYLQGDILITHRIAAQQQDAFITKGDANDTADSDPVFPEQIVGKVVMIIPKVGALIAFLHTPAGLAVLFVCAVLLLIVPTKSSDQSERGAADEDETE